MPVIFLDVYPALTPNGTLLTTLTDEDVGTFEMRQGENDLGSGTFTIRRDHAQATEANLATGNYVKVRIPLIQVDPVFGFWLDEHDDSIVAVDEEGAEILERSGPGTLAILGRARLLDDIHAPSPPASPYRGTIHQVPGYWRWETQPYGAILTRFVEEGQNEPGIPLQDVTIDFDRDNDSDTVAWPPIVRDVRFPIGTDGLTLLKAFAQTGELYVRATPDLLIQGRQARGTDRTSGTFAAGKVRLVKGVNIDTGLNRTGEGSRSATHAIVVGAETTYRQVVAPSYTTPPGRWVTVNYEESNDTGVLDKVGAEELLRAEADQQALHLEIHAGDAELTGRYLPYKHFLPGDLITLHTGTAAWDYTESDQRVTGFVIKLHDTSDDATPELTVRSLTFVVELGGGSEGGFGDLSVRASASPWLPSGWFAQPDDPGTKSAGSMWATGLPGTLKMSDGLVWDHEVLFTVNGNDDGSNDDAAFNIVATAPGSNGSASATTVADSATGFATVQREATGAGDARGWTFVTSTGGDAIATTIATSVDGLAHTFTQAHATGDGDTDAGISATSDGSGAASALATAISASGAAQAGIEAGDGSATASVRTFGSGGLFVVEVVVDGDTFNIRAGTADPSSGAGIAAPLGSEYHRDNGGVGELWYKVGAADTAWSLVGGGSSGACDHEHTYERFVAAGGSPELFTLGHTPLFGVEVTVNGPAADPLDVTLTGLDVEVNTTAGDVVVIRFAVACGDLAIPGGMVEDGDTGSMGAIFWYYVMPEADFAALTPGPWAPDTFYIPGGLVFEDSSHFARYASAPRLSDSVGNQPNWTSVTEGQFIADLNGYWVRMPDGWTPADPIAPWVAATGLTYPGVPGGGVGSFFLAPVNGHVYVGDVSSNTGATQPAFPVDPCAGIDRFYIGGGEGFVQAYALDRPYVAASVVVTRNGSPESVTELDPDTAMIELDATTWDFADLIVVTYTAVC